MEAQIHSLEQEAYTAVLRAFKAQSDAITWVTRYMPFVFSCLSTRLLICSKSYSVIWYQEKESLITELRKELRVSDDEHREILLSVNADETIRRLRFVSKEFPSCSGTLIWHSLYHHLLPYTVCM